MELPKTKVAAQLKDPRSLILYGPPKVGKTGLLAQLPDCLILDLEKGAGFTESLRVEANSLKDLKEVGDEILKQGKPYKRIAVDTLKK